MKLQIERSIRIQKPGAQLYKIISDLKQWNTWSPWNHAEPTCKTEVVGNSGTVGQSLTWDGEVVGSGKMTTAKLENNRQIDFKLEFFKPWKSVAAVTFLVKEMKADECEVTWKLDSTMPIFMFFFKNMMMAYMKADFDRGLKMLKELAETGAVVSKSTYKGENSFAGFQVLGIRTSCKISDMPNLMQRDFQKLGESLQKAQMPKPEMMLSLYHKYDITKGTCEYTAGAAYKEGQAVKNPDGMETIQYGDHRALLVDHYGPYRNLGNPWSMIVSYQRGKKKRVLKKVPMYEVYKTMPDGRPEKDIYTQVVMPIK